MRFLIWLFLCVSFPFHNFAQKLVQFTHQEQRLSVSKNMVFLEDKTAALSLPQVLQQQDKFQPITQDIFSRPASKSVYWFKVSVQNTSGQDLWLEVGDTRLWYLDFYAPDDANQYTKPLLLGAMRPYSNRVFPSSFYCVPLNNAHEPQTKTYYLRVGGRLNIQLPFNVGTHYSLIQQFDIYDQVANVFIGLVLAMLVYNLFLYVSTRDKLYLIYVGYLVMVLITTTFNNGQSLMHTPWFWYYFMVWQTPLFVLITWFVDLYLELKLYARKMRRWLWALTLVLGGVFPLLNVVGVNQVYTLRLFQLTVLIYSFSLLAGGIMLWRKGRKNARFYILGWSSVIVASFVYLFASNGILPFNAVTRQSLYVGFGIEALMFSLALGDRLNMLKKEKDEALAQNLSLITNQKEALEQKVKERTYEIQEKNEEVEAQNQMMRATHQELQQAYHEIQEQNEEVAAQNEIMAATHRELRKAYQEINKKNENLLASIRYAETIQKALLSLRQGIINALGADNFFILFKPRDIVSGDFYYIETLEHNRLLIAAIDCTGHGIPGAFMSMIGYEVMTEIVKIRKETQPNMILELLHRYVASVLKQSETNNRDGMDVSLVVLDKPNNKMSFAGAKNPLLYIQNGELSLIKGDKRSIGGKIRSQIAFTSHTIDISTSTVLYLFSDGYQDQFGGNKNKKFMLSRLKTLCLDMHQKEMRDQQQILDNTLEDWMTQGNEVQIDDVLVMGVRV
jgi:serine phosphatase RsbU (regulator of sigma subunit)